MDMTFKNLVGLVLYPKMEQLILDVLDGNKFMTRFDELAKTHQFEEAFILTLLEQIEDKRKDYELFDIYASYIERHSKQPHETIISSFEDIDDRMSLIGE